MFTHCFLSEAIKLAAHARYFRSFYSLWHYLHYRIFCISPVASFPFSNRVNEWLHGRRMGSSPLLPSPPSPLPHPLSSVQWPNHLRACIGQPTRIDDIFQRKSETVEKSARAHLCLFVSPVYVLVNPHYIYERFSRYI